MAANKQCITRLQKEYKTLLKEPVPHVTAHPSPSNLLEWHYVLEGAKGSEFEGGVYHGKLVFPPQYPFKPPSISMFTPNGRFATNTKLCLSMTDYHPESWNPMWSVGTILTGLLSFMYDNQPTTGSIVTSKVDKERMAAESLAFNAKNPMFRKLFPEWIEEHTRREALQAGSINADSRQQPGTDAAAGQRTGQAGAQAGTGDRLAPDAAEQLRAAGLGNLPDAGGPPPQQPGSTIVTFAIIVVVLAAVLVPLFNTKGVDMLHR